MTPKFQNINYDIDKLPTMPLIATRMVEMLNSPRSSAEELARVISGDPAVSARVLKIANSAFYAMSRQVKTLSTAIVILGEKTLRNLVLAASLRGMNANFGPVEQMLWEDSMTCALGSRFLARFLKVGDPEEAFVAGLFRHIGRVVLNNQESKAYQELVRQQKNCGRQLMEEERARFGIGHAELGAAVLEQWRLSEVMSLVALHHHDEDLDAIEDEEARTLTAIVNIAGEFPLLLGVFGDAEAEEAKALIELPGAKYFSLEAERMDEILEEFGEVFEKNREDFLG